MSELQLPDDKTFGALVDTIRRLPGARTILLFGSQARGDAGLGSDIDLLVLFDDRASRDRGRRRITRFTAILPLFTQPLCMTVTEFQRSPLRAAVLREGRMLYARNWDLLENAGDALQRYALVSYDATALPRSAKVGLSQVLNGRWSGKYRYAGLLDRVGGSRIGPGVVLVPSDGLSEVERALRSNGARYAVRHVWGA